MDTDIAALEILFAELRTRKDKFPFRPAATIDDAFLNRLVAAASDLELGPLPDEIGPEVHRIWPVDALAHPDRVQPFLEELEVFSTTAHRAAERSEQLRNELEVWDERLAALDAFQRLLDELNRHTPIQGEPTP